MRLHVRFKVLHCVKQAALEDTGTAAPPHDPDAALSVELTWQTAMLVVPTGLTQSPAPLGLTLKLLSLADHVTAGLRRGTRGGCC